MKMIEKDDPRLRFMPESDVMKANDIVQVYRDRWWAIDPERGLIFYHPSPTKNRTGIEGAYAQCNSNKDIAADLQSRMYPWAQIKQIPMVLVPVNPKDYY